MVAISNTDRSKKFRAKKRGTPEGCQDIKAKNRLYKARSRRKKQIKRLTYELTSMKNDLHPVHHQQWVESEALGYTACLLVRRETEERELTQDEQKKMDIDVLKRQIKEMKKIKSGEKVELHHSEGVNGCRSEIENKKEKKLFANNNGLNDEIISSLRMKATMNETFEVKQSGCVEVYDAITNGVILGAELILSLQVSAVEIRDPFDAADECYDSTDDDLFDNFDALFPLWEIG